MHLAPLDARLALSQRVVGHPLSIRLLAGRFSDDSATDLTTFLTNIEAELTVAEQKTPGSLQDPERQKTLYACMEYSTKRLSSELRTVLDTVSIFQASFLSDFASYVLDDSQQTPLHLQTLARLGLLNVTVRTFEDGELVLFNLHPVMRWYIQQHQPDQQTILLERYGEVYEYLVREAAQPGSTYERSAQMRYLVRQSFADGEAALAYLMPAARSALTHHLAQLYDRLGQNLRALALLEEALSIDQEQGDVLGVAVTQQAMANVLVQQGHRH
jgi:tetratricopeptide (TPR) repeat protein